MRCLCGPADLGVSLTPASAGPSLAWGFNKLLARYHPEPPAPARAWHCQWDRSLESRSWG